MFGLRAKQLLTAIFAFSWLGTLKKMHSVLFQRRRIRVLGVIPARYSSTRFPGKPLVPIAGIPMIIRTHAQAAKARRITRLIVATDDERIKRVCEEAGAEVIMTDGDIPNGTERCAQALQRSSGTFDIVVNIQGDEPLIDPEIIDSVIEALQVNPDVLYSTPVAHLEHDEVLKKGRVKCIVDKSGYAIYFSRGLLPSNKTGEADPSYDYWLHLGLQCYDADFLSLYAKLPSTPCQLQEDLEQLKAIEHGYRIKVVKVRHAAHGVDVPDDVASIEAILASNEYSGQFGFRV